MRFPPFRGRRGLFLGGAALAAPFLLAVPQQWLIPSWYEVSTYVAAGLLVLNVVTAAILIYLALRRSRWKWMGRIAAGFGLLAIVFLAAVVTWMGGTREGVFVCGRGLDRVVPCPGGGEAYEFTDACIAGNPEVQVEVRPGLLPFMVRVPVASAEEACDVLRSERRP